MKYTLVNCEYTRKYSKLKYLNINKYYNLNKKISKVVRVNKKKCDEWFKWYNSIGTWL